MQLPSTVYVALGASAAAIIGGWVSITNIIIAKDQKISEFRQDWIDELRDCVSSLMQEYTMLAGTVFHYHNIQENITEEEADKKSIAAMFKHSPIINLQISKIRLLLNPEEHIKALDILSTLEKHMTDVKGSFIKPEKTVKHTDEFEKEIKTILKTEWERVKSGEPDYIKYKEISKFFPIVLFVLMILAIVIADLIKA